MIDAAHREAAAPEHAVPALDALTAQVEALAARVSALERSLAAPSPRGRDGDSAPPERRERRAAVVDAAARVRAIELALAGYSRDAIARELAATMPPGEIEGVLDEVLR